MNRVRRFTLGALLALSAASAFGAAQAGREYALIDPPQPSGAPGKVEVIEFFSFACPHCNHFEPALEAWRRNLPANVVLRRVPVIFGHGEWLPLAKLEIALEALGESDRLAGKVFHALHEEHINLGNPSICADWVAHQGVDRQKFLEAFNSFAVETRTQQANMKAQAYGIDQVPSLVVDGRFRTNPALAGGSNESTLAVVDELIQLVDRDRAAH